VGFGLYGTAISTGDAEWTRDYFSTQSFSTDIHQNEIGIVMETKVAANSLFNYRLQIASVSSSYGEFKYEGVAFNNIFGFGVWRTPSFRLWIGPQIGYKEIDSTNKTPDVFILGFDVGPVVGINYHVSQTISLTAEIGNKIGSTVQARQRDRVVTHDIDENRTYLNIGILFRLSKDNYLK